MTALPHPRELVLYLAALVCACDGGSDDPSGDGDRPRWLMDNWLHYSNERHGDTVDSLILLGDGNGKYVADTEDSSSIEGGWSLAGHTLTIGSTTLDIAWTDSCSVISAGGRTFVGEIDKPRPDCPTSVTPLSSVEQCIVGDWSSFIDDGLDEESDWLTFGADRTYLERWDDTLGTMGAVAGQWRLLDDGDIEITHPGGTSEVRSSVRDVLALTRDGSVASGCDDAAFTRFIGGCDGDRPFECDGADLRDCSTGMLYDCDAACVDAGMGGAADPPCGLASTGDTTCLCE